MNYYTYLIKPIHNLKRLQYGGSLTHQELLPVPDILIVEEDKEETGGFFLYRYTKTGEFGGDTWHENLENAKYQANYEYGDSVGQWREIPEEVKDFLAYTLKKLKN